MLVSERKILWRIFDPVREGANWRRIKNKELYELIGEPSVITFIKLGGIHWAGHVAQMNYDDAFCMETLTELEEAVTQDSNGRTVWLKMLKPYWKSETRE